jgi:hypothetical protein
MISRKKFGNLFHRLWPILFINDGLGHSDLIVVLKNRLVAPLSDKRQSHFTDHLNLGDATLMLEPKDEEFDVHHGSLGHRDSTIRHPINHLSHSSVMACLSRSTDLWHCSGRDGLHPSRASHILDQLIHILVVGEAHLLKVNHSPSSTARYSLPSVGTPNAANMARIAGRSVVDVILVGKRIKNQKDWASQIVISSSGAKVINFSNFAIGFGKTVQIVISSRTQVEWERT